MVICLNIELDSCRCQQCSHITNVKHQCECCVFLLHGKRSVPETSHRKDRHSAKTQPRSSARRRQAPYILDILEPFNRDSINRLVGMTKSSDLPNIRPYWKPALDITAPGSELDYEYENDSGFEDITDWTDGRV